MTYLPVCYQVWRNNTSIQSEQVFEGRKQVIIPVNEEFRIATDPNQWIVEKARTRNGKKDWTPKLFYPTFESALKGLGGLMVRLSDAETLVDAIRDVEKVSTTLSQALTIRIEGLEESQDRGHGCE